MQSDCDARLRHPPLSCRTSPPQGGDRARWRFRHRNAGVDETVDAANLPPCGGDVRQDRGGQRRARTVKANVCSVSVDKSRAAAVAASAATAVRIASVACTRRLRSDRRRAASRSAHRLPPRAARQRPRRRARRQPDIGHDSIHARRAAAIDHDRHLRAEPAFQPGSCDALANALGKRRRIGDFVRIEPGKRAGLDRHAAAYGDAERIDIAAKLHRRSRRQPPDLQTAARGDFDDAVAVTARRFARARSMLGRKSCSDRIEPHEQAVAGLHRRGERRAERRGASGAFMPRSPGRAPRRSARRGRRRRELRSGCQSPRRRAEASRSAMARAAAGFSRRMKSRTAGSPR